MTSASDCDPFFTLSYLELRELVLCADRTGLVCLMEEVILAEANVFRCAYQDKLVNLKFDLDYGASIEPVDALQPVVLHNLRQALAQVLASSPRFGQQR